MVIIGVFAIILDNKKRFLLCHRRDHDLWNLPGGGLEKGESPWEGVIRETKEETGLDVEIERVSGIYYKPEKDEIVFQFVCKKIAGEIKLNDEADKIEYFAYEYIPRNTVTKQVERIKDFIDNPDNIIMKKQTGRSSISMVKDGLI